MSDTQRIAGELHLSLEAVAACYRIELTVLREAYELGLVGQRVGASIVIAASRLDRVAEIVRLHVHHGIDLRALVLRFEPEP